MVTTKLTLAFTVAISLQVAFGQPVPQPEPPSASAPMSPAATAPPTSPQQLDDLVAPIALYPDPLLGEILAASTYPMEVAEAEQWLQDHHQWKPSKLMDEAKKQNWDPSVQGLVAFPDVMTRLTQDMNWTTQLGNAFLANQGDVMAAVQRMRTKAQANGKLQSNAQINVMTQNQGGQQAISIEPANPNMWYVPNYNPAWVWGPPVYGYYPPLLYPAVDVGWGWWPGIDLGLYFGGWGGWGWGGWGWGFNWFGGGIFINNSFFHRYGFEHFHGGNAFGNSAWTHNPEHRLGVPYASRAVENRFAARSGGGLERGGAERGGAERGSFAGRQSFSNERPSQRFGSSGFEQRGYTGNHSVFGGYHDGGAARMQSDHGFSSLGGGRIGGGGGFHGGGGGFHGGGGGRR